MPVLFTLESKITANTKSFEDGINRAQSSLKKLGNTVASESQKISGGGLPPLDNFATMLRGAGALAGLTAVSRTVSRIGMEFREATKAVSQFGDAGDSMGRALVSSLPILRGFFEGISNIQDVLLGVDDANTFADNLAVKLKSIQANKAATSAAQMKAALEFDAEQAKFAKIIVDRRNERIKLAEEVQAERMKVIDENESLRKSMQDADFALAQRIYEAGRTNFENLFDELVEAKDLLDRGILGKPEFDRFSRVIRDRAGQGGTSISSPVGVSASLTSPQSFVRLFTAGVREDIVISKEQLQEQKEFNRKLERLIDATKDDTGVIN